MTSKGNFVLIQIEKLHSEINEYMMKSIADVLCNCQSYMKGRDVRTCECIIIIVIYICMIHYVPVFTCPFHQDECSFVSLRDVERIMLVFGYFLETYIPACKASSCS